jgi:hypothetical protein
LQGHRFERARREWGHEEGVFIDGAFMDTHEVIVLANLLPAEQEQVLAEHRRKRKDEACLDRLQLHARRERGAGRTNGGTTRADDGKCPRAFDPLFPRRRSLNI